MLVGAGGHARVVLAAIRSAGALRVIGLLDRDRAKHGTTLDGAPILGGDELLGTFDTNQVEALVTVGSTDVSNARAELFARIKALGMRTPLVLHPSATIAEASGIGEGSVVLAHAIVNPGARLGANVIVNTAAIVEHDVTIGSHAHIAPGAIIGGMSRIGDRCHVGLGARVLQGVQVGDGVLIGAGAVVIADVPSGERVVGVPARPIGGRGAQRPSESSS